MNKNWWEIKPENKMGKITICGGEFWRRIKILCFFLIFKFFDIELLHVCTHGSIG